MPLRTESLEEPQLNLTPMIDIVFLLIIFFMVGTRFSEIEQQKFDIELPTATAVAPMTSRPDSIVVNVSRSGEFAIGDATVSLQELERRLTAARTAYAKQAVLIRGDGEGIYQPIIDVMNLCNQLKIHQISLAFQPVAGASP